MASVLSCRTTSSPSPSARKDRMRRLAARLTGYKIDIKSETQAIESGDLPENYMEQMGMMGEEGYTGDFDEEEYEDGDAVCMTSTTASYDDDARLTAETTTVKRSSLLRRTGRTVQN